MGQKTFEDFDVGDTFKTASVTVTETHLVNWGCLTGDWYPLHFDKEFARSSVFKERVAHGPLIFGLAVGLVGMAGIYDDSIIAWLGCDKMRMNNAVRIGDTIHVEAEVLSKRETSKADRGVVTVRYIVKNQIDEKVMDLEFVLMMRRRQP